MKVLVALACMLAVLTGLRVRDWHDEATLWGAAAQMSPLRPRVWVNLGRAQQLDGRDTEALLSYHRAIGLSFDDRRLHGGNLYARLAAETDTATVLMHQGNVQGAWNELSTVLRDPEWPMFPYAVFHRGAIEAATGQCAAAKRDWIIAAAEDGTIMPPPIPQNLCRD